MVDQKSGAHPEAAGGESAHRGLSLRAFAREIGVSDGAVRKAISVGRLVKSVGKNAKNQPYIINVTLAHTEWDASSRTSTGVRTDVRTAPPSGAHLATMPRPTPVTAPSPPPPDVAWREDGDQGERTAGGQLVFATTLIDAQTAATNERARKLKYENDVTERRLIPLERVNKEAFEAERIIRERILNLPARIAGELHAERDLGRFYLKLEGALRETLNVIAETLEATANG